MLNTSKSEEVEGVLKLLDPRLREILPKYGYRTLTDIQVEAIPKVLQRRHVIVVAPTGSGKTESALFPILSMMLGRREVKPIKVVYVTPLRALNRDLFLRISKLCRELGFRAEIRHGDTPQSRRKLIAEKPPHILITTPETFSYILVHRKLRKALENVEWVVIDEFHELMGSKRGAHLLVDLERLRRIAGNFQRIALSASIGDLRLAREMLAYERVVVDVVIPKVRETDVRVLVPRIPEDKARVIGELVKEEGPALVFTNTRAEAEILGSKLSKVVNVRVHHGSLSKAEREEAEKLLKSDDLKGVVATSSLELGIDVGHVNIVVQSSSPKQAIKLLQRVGRSLHRVGMKARGVIVAERNLDDILESLVIARRVVAGDLETPRPYENPLDILAHVLVGMGSEGRDVTLDEAYDLLRRTYIFRNLSYAEFTNVVNLASMLGYLKVSGNSFRSSKKGLIYFLTTTMIVDAPRYKVVDAVSGKVIGNLDEDFVVMLNNGETIVLGGRLWDIISIDEDQKRVYVEPSVSEETRIPRWEGETIPVSLGVAREVCGLRRLLALGHLPNQYRGLIEREDLEPAINVLREHIRRGYPLPSESEVLVEIISHGRTPVIVIHACLGTLGNRALSHLISSIFMKRLDTELRFKVDPYRVIFEVPISLRPEVIEELVREALYSTNVEEAVKYSARRSRILLLITYRVLSRFGIITKDTPSRLARKISERYLREEDSVITREAMNELLTYYMDLNTLKSLVERIRKGRARVKVIKVSAPSPIAREGFKVPFGYDVVKASSMPKHMVAELVKRRVMGKEVGLVCLMCGNVWKSKISELPERLTCSSCGYSLIGVVSGAEDLRVIKNIVIRGKEAGRKYMFALSGEERRIFEKLVDTAKLVLTYGKRAVIALSVRGVGPESAKKALGIQDEVEFYAKLYEIEREYLRTRMYWK